MIRHAEMTDLSAIADLEKISYPSAESASAESIAGRLTVFPDCFWLFEKDGKIVSFINGMATQESDLRDAMYEQPQLHEPDGKWLMIFSVVTDPLQRGRGYAAQLMKQVIADSRASGRAGIVLTCKERLLPFYAQFGYQSEGISQSVHGNAVWYQMRLRFSDGENGIHSPWKQI